MIDRVDLNSDLGESWGAYTIGEDQQMLSIVTSANVACGFHGGDSDVMSETVCFAKSKGVAVGAHPSYLDLWGFGRRRIVGDTPAELERTIVYQIGALKGIAAMHGHPVTHVKAHGSLGNVSAENLEVATAIARGIKAADPELIYIVMPGRETERAGQEAGLRLAREVYADRTYEDDGNLTPRAKDGAVIHDAELACARVLEMLERGAITSRTGARVDVAIDTICVHGDNPAGVAMAQQIRDAIVAAGVAIEPFHTFVD